MPKTIPPPLHPGLKLTALAPMQDVTDWRFMNIIAQYGSPDYFFTEYFRVYTNSTLDKNILRSITENSTNRPIFAQIIGESIPDLVRIAKELSNYPVAGIDLNMGCPAPKIYRKNVGGGLLRDPEKVNQILGNLRDSIDGLFTVKMRIGFENTANFDRILELINLHHIDLLSLHGRTVKEKYHSPVNYDLIAHATQKLNCPVLANGNVTSAITAGAVLEKTGAAGVMIGRAAIRNPWIFQQIRAYFSGQPISRVTLAQVRDYIEKLRINPTIPTPSEKARVNYMKMYLNFIGLSIDTTGNFIKEMRLAQTENELFGICDRYLLTFPEREFAPEPYPGLVARPNCETNRQLVPTNT
ncbi:MAG TPA: dihydrouridine synthase [Cyanobacteria bacterium UBA11149]|nr:dihydrouridine synthase [Cyanobacteria bacterium UBA11367]HBE60196.1 dihydrouridine synthase [Cyanobacteria bacterium UBA11366]HBK64497.1 dihydrouridine synthase [Cyanobacteria bacterium UBA11166]HBR76461.1 dihydrouridine synthase [Cyanobacteria bacterium UBA11159]HBS71981.1 dihydrouridine synthase [Cyanobacteria bacterium UBA11153]HBW91500.1 dihydrouridine synthase [Cyanobacteria bacterium UBA11149]HCA95612.1 dihydrouridine synthase [Cyanobacteria bacterium UBA9226]